MSSERMHRLHSRITVSDNLAAGPALSVRRLGSRGPRCRPRLSPLGDSLSPNGYTSGGPRSRKSRTFNPSFFGMDGASRQLMRTAALRRGRSDAVSDSGPQWWLASVGCGPVMKCDAERGGVPGAPRDAPLGAVAPGRPNGEVDNVS